MHEINELILALFSNKEEIIENKNLDNILYNI